MKLSKLEQKLLEDLDKFINAEKQNGKNIQHVTLYTDQMKMVTALINKSKNRGYETLRGRLYQGTDSIIYRGMKLNCS